MKDYYETLQQGLNGEIEINGKNVKLPDVINDEWVYKYEHLGTYSTWGICGVDVSHIDMSGLSLEAFCIIKFDENTIFSKEQKAKFKPQEILENGKSFGLGMDDLHQAGINGNGVNIAIIDQSFDTDIQELKRADGTSKVKLYDDRRETYPDFEFFHGKTVATLCVGETVGVAPGASLYFFSNTFWPTKEGVAEIETIYEQIQALNAKGANIGIVSESHDVRVQNDSEIDHLTNDKWYKIFEESNVAKISTRDYGNISCRGERNNYDDINNPDSISISRDSVEEDKEFLLLPVGGRTYPQVGDNGYMYSGRWCGSWGVPQISGLLAIARQMNPEITFDEFDEICAVTCDRNSEGLKIINPENMVREIDERNKQLAKENSKRQAISENSSRLIGNLDRIKQKGKESKTVSMEDLTRNALTDPEVNTASVRKTDRNRDGEIVKGNEVHEVID